MVSAVSGEPWYSRVGRRSAESQARETDPIRKRTKKEARFLTVVVTSVESENTRMNPEVLD